MTEKTIHEMRIIETDDGFRIEIKGDKEEIKKMGFGPFGQKGSRAAKFFGRGHGMFRRHGHAYGPPPWAYDCEEPVEEMTSPETEA